MRPPLRLLPVALAIVAIFGTPDATAAAFSWTFTVSPTSVAQGSTTEFAARVTLTSTGGNVGCLTISVPNAFTAVEARVSGTRTGAEWSAFSFGNHIWAISTSGGGKLSDGDWVEVAVRATAVTAGTHGWIADASSGACASDPRDLVPQTAWVTVAPVSSHPTPTPAAPLPTPPPATPAPTQSITQPTSAPTSAPPTSSATPTDAGSREATMTTPEPDPSMDPADSSARSSPPAASAEPSTDLVVPMRSDRPDGGTAAPIRSDPDGGTASIPRALTGAAGSPVGPGEKPAPAADPILRHPSPEDADVVTQIVNSAATGIRRAVNPAAAAQVATTFGFPLSLMMAVLLFLVIQDQMDRRDPKLRAAPRTFFDTIVRFHDEAEL